ncbi:hypothetical protein EON82_14510 [bacterium]|nr:MAG: hypothetical protein EON82_14510 [bacterium]
MCRNQRESPADRAHRPSRPSTCHRPNEGQQHRKAHTLCQACLGEQQCHAKPIEGRVKLRSGPVVQPLAVQRISRDRQQADHYRNAYGEREPDRPGGARHEDRHTGKKDANAEFIHGLPKMIGKPERFSRVQNRSMREWLIDGFRYDLWANERWLPLVPAALDRIDAPLWPEAMPTDPQARLEEIFAHLLRAQRTWLERLGPNVHAEGEHWLTDLHRAWLEILERRDPDERIQYRNLKGMPFENSVRGIALHVINHGTYHRGQLSALATSMGIEAPETDLFLWQLETGSAAAL